MKPSTLLNGKIKQAHPSRAGDVRSYLARIIFDQRQGHGLAGKGLFDEEIHAELRPIGISYHVIGLCMFRRYSVQIGRRLVTYQYPAFGIENDGGDRELLEHRREAELAAHGLVLRGNFVFSAPAPYARAPTRYINLGSDYVINLPRLIENRSKHPTPAMTHALAVAPVAFELLAGLLRGQGQKARVRCWTSSPSRNC